MPEEHSLYLTVYGGAVRHPYKLDQQASRITSQLREALKTELGRFDTVLCDHRNGVKIAMQISGFRSVKLNLSDLPPGAEPQESWQEFLSGIHGKTLAVVDEKNILAATHALNADNFNSDTFLYNTFGNIYHFRSVDGAWRYERRISAGFVQDGITKVYMPDGSAQLIA